MARLICGPTRGPVAGVYGVDEREEELQLAKAEGASKPVVLSGGGGEVITRG